MDLPRILRPARRLVALSLGLALLAGPAAALARDIQDDILAQTAAIRGLGPTAMVPLEFVAVDQLRADLLKSYDDEEMVRELEISRKLLVLLGLLSPEADLHAMLVDLYAENVQGYYNNDDKKMYVVSGVPLFGANEKVTLSHEFTHALQDQYFDLKALREASEENGDRSAAVTALIEGDAVLTMVLYARQHLSQQELIQLQTGGGASSLDRAPLVIRDEVSFPYNEGALFAQQLHRQGGFEALNQAFRDPPRSTEQIIHAEKYLAGEAPVEVGVPDLAAALGPGWTQLRSDVLGELDVRILLEQFSDPIAAAQGSVGWGGDRYVLLEHADGRLVLAISTAWDDDNEAGEFFNRYVPTVNRRFGSRARRTEDGPGRIVWAIPDGAILLQKAGPSVLLVMAPDEQLLEAVVTAVRPDEPPTTARGGRVMNDE